MRRLGVLTVAIGSVVHQASDTLWADLMAGIARVDMTPPLSMKATLGGYGDRMNKPAEGIHDRVFGKALVLSDGTKRFVLVTADVLGFPPAIKPAVMAKLADTDLKPEQVMLLPSHSHASIEVNSINPKNVLKIPQIGLFQKELYDLTVDNLVKVIRDALGERVPVTVGTTSIPLEGWNRNRREGNEAVDNELTLTRIDKMDGEPFAVLVNWTAHPTFLQAEDMLFSGGWPGQMQRMLTSLIGRGVTVMYYNGAQGDQAPIARSDPAKSALTTTAAATPISNWERAEQYGRELAIIVWRQWEKTRTAGSAVLDYRIEEVVLPQPTVHPDFMKTGGAEYGLSPEIMGPILTALLPRKTTIGYFRLGDLLIVGIPGEMSAELGLQVKQKVRGATGIKHTVIGGLANEWVSYILSAEEYDKGGYESSVSLYGRTLGQTLVDGALRGAAALRQ